MNRLNPKHMLEKTLDLVFPPTRDMLLVRNCEPEDLLAYAHARMYEEHHFLLSYESELTRALIHEAKFHNSNRACELLGHVLGTHLHAMSLTQDHILIPIPLSRARRRARGYNQVEEMARCVASLSPPIQSNILRRKKDTKPQTELKKKERMENMRDVFEVRNTDLVTGKHIILIDDVVTTGATLRAAKAAFSRHNPSSITTIALAR